MKSLFVYCEAQEGGMEAFRCKGAEVLDTMRRGEYSEQEIKAISHFVATAEPGDQLSWRMGELFCVSGKVQPVAS